MVKKKHQKLNKKKSKQLQHHKTIKRFTETYYYWITIVSERDQLNKYTRTFFVWSLHFGDFTCRNLLHLHIQLYDIHKKQKNYHRQTK